MIKWLWLALIPSLVFADSHPYNMRKDPLFLDVYPDKIIVMNEGLVIEQSELALTDNPFENFLKDLTIQRDMRYVLLIMRPGSEQLQQQIHQVIQKYEIDIGVDVWEESREFSAKKLMVIYETGTDDPPKPDPFEHIRMYPVTVEKDRIILDNDKIVVTSEELQIPGNPFEKLVDRFEANGGNPYIFPSPTSNPLAAELWEVMRLRAPLMVSNCFAKNTTVLVPTPIEANTEGKQAVILECRNNQLIYASLDQVQQSLREDHIGLQLADLDPQTQYISFFVRPDSFDIFRKARKAAWDNKLESTCVLLSADEPVQVDSETINTPQFDHSHEIKTKP